MAVEVKAKSTISVLKMGAGQMGVIVEWGSLTDRYKGLIVLMTEDAGIVGLDGVTRWDEPVALNDTHLVELLPDGATLTYTEPAVKYAK